MEKRGRFYFEFTSKNLSITRVSWDGYFRSRVTTLCAPPRGDFPEFSLSKWLKSCRKTRPREFSRARKYTRKNEMEKINACADSERTVLWRRRREKEKSGQNEISLNHETARLGRFWRFDDVKKNVNLRQKCAISMTGRTTSFEHKSSTVKYSIRISK